MLSRQSIHSGLEDAEDLVEDFELVVGIGLVLGNDAFNKFIDVVHVIFPPQKSF